MSTVSIICTVRNGEHFISETIESIIQQTYRDWEMIIVDDGSNDDTKKIIEFYQKKDSRIKVIQTEGIGRGKCLNLALNNCRGKYVGNIDADDPSHPQRLEIELKFLESHDYALICTESLKIWDDSKPIWREYKIENINIIDVTKSLVFYNPVCHSSVLIRKDVLNKVGNYDDNRVSQFDYELWVRLAANGYKLGKLNIKLSSKRLHKKQSFERRRRIQYLLSTMKVQKTAINKLNGPSYLYIFLFLRFIYGTLPLPVRVVLRSIRSLLS